MPAKIEQYFLQNRYQRAHVIGMKIPEKYCQYIITKKGEYNEAE